MIITIIREVMAVAKANGHKLPADAIQYVTFRSPEDSVWRPNILLDREQGQVRRPIEFEVTLRDPIKRAAELGVEVPIMTTAYELLKSAR